MFLWGKKCNKNVTSTPLELVLDIDSYVDIFFVAYSAVP